MQRFHFKWCFHNLPSQSIKMLGALLLFMLLVSCGVPSSFTHTTSPPPITTEDQKIALRESIIEVLEPGDGTIPRLTDITYSFPEKGDITISWAIHDKGTLNSTLLGAQIDATNILKVLEKNNTHYLYVILSGTYSMQDEIGNLTKIEAMNLGFNKSKLNKVDWEEFQSYDIYDLSEVTMIHPLFQ